MTESTSRTERIPRVAVIGTGTMGSAMAQRLVGAGLAVGVWSRHLSSTVAATDKGATAFELAADAAKEADVVITMLPTADTTEDVMFGGQGLSAMRQGSIWVQMATIGSERTERLAERIQTNRPDVVFVDAPVSGSRAPAESGQLLILASGPDTAASSLEPVFGVLGRSTLWLGPAGTGSRMKLVLNTWLAFQTEGAAEAAALAEHLGVPTPALFAALPRQPTGVAVRTEQVDQDGRERLSRRLRAGLGPEGSRPGGIRCRYRSCADRRRHCRPVAGISRGRVEWPRCQRCPPRPRGGWLHMKRGRAVEVTARSNSDSLPRRRSW